MQKAIGIDLDGVIRHNNKSLNTGEVDPALRTKKGLLALYRTGGLQELYYITDITQVKFIERALEALALLNTLHYDCYVLTNQEAIGVGALSVEQWENIRDYMNGKIEQAGGRIAGWMVCPHAPDAGCRCRKPAPGLFYDLQGEYGVSLRNMYFIGDMDTDMQAAFVARCKGGIRIEHGAGNPAIPRIGTENGMFCAVCHDLMQAVRYIEKNNS